MTERKEAIENYSLEELSPEEKFGFLEGRKAMKREIYDSLAQSGLQVADYTAIIRLIEKGVPE